MRAPLLALLLAAVLVLAAVPVTAQGKRDEDDTRGRDRPHADTSTGGDGATTTTTTAPDDRGRGRSGDDVRAHDDRGRNRGDRHEGMSDFQVDSNGRDVDGRHVDFQVNDTGIENFSADGRHLFNLTVEPEDDDRDKGDKHEKTTLRKDGKALVVQGPNFTVKAHDLPGAVAKVETKGFVRLTFSDFTRFVRTDDGKAEFVLGNLTGTVRAKNLTVDGTNLSAKGDVLVLLHQPRGQFDKHREDLVKAIGKGHVGAEATLALAAAEGNATPDLDEEVVSYGNVTMTTLRAERGNLTLAVEGHGTEGRVVVLNVDGRILGAERADHLVVLMDNLSIPQAADVPDVLDPDNDGFSPEWYVVFDPATKTFQLLVSVPHYSVHILSVLTSIPLPPPSVVIGVLAGLMLLVPSAYVLFRRKE